MNDNENMDEFFENGEMVINYKRVVESKESLSVTRLLAANLMASPYSTIGDFLKGINTADLEQLLVVSEDGDDPNYPDLLLIGEMLVRAEGLTGSCTVEEMQENLTKLITFLAIEGLYRKGLVRIFRENMSFGEDMSARIIVEKI